MKYQDRKWMILINHINVFYKSSNYIFLKRISLEKLIENQWCKLIIRNKTKSKFLLLFVICTIIPTFLIIGAQATPDKAWGKSTGQSQFFGFWVDRFDLYASVDAVVYYASSGIPGWYIRSYETDQAWNAYPGWPFLACWKWKNIDIDTYVYEFSGRIVKVVHQIYGRVENCYNSNHYATITVKAWVEGGEFVSTSYQVIVHYNNIDYVRLIESGTS
ncbi:MAG: hypothetical protein ACFE9Z_07290 [Promethearchaeota archaeon]